MKGEYPKITVVTPSFNQGKYLEKTILSVLEQGYPNLEYIIIDGGSSDESVDIIKKYADRLTYWVSEPDRGQSHAINKGFERATGEILGWLNSDDWYHPGALQTVAETFAANPEAGAVVGAGEMTDGRNVLVMEPFDVTVESLNDWHDRFFMQPSCFFTARAWVECGPLDERFNFSMDLDLWLKIAGKFKFSSSSKILSTSLVHSGAKTTAFACGSITEAAAVIAAHGGFDEAMRLNGKFIKELCEKRLLVTEYQHRIAQLDNIILTREHEIAVRDQRIAELDLLLADRELAIESFKQCADDLKKSIEELHNSMSWKVTRPLRWLCEKVAGLKQDHGS